LQGVYAAGDPANPTTGGLTGGSYVTGLQATLLPTDRINHGSLFSANIGIK